MFRLLGHRAYIEQWAVDTRTRSKQARITELSIYGLQGFELQELGLSGVRVLGSGFRDCRLPRSHRHKAAKAPPQLVRQFGF